MSTKFNQTSDLEWTMNVAFSRRLALWCLMVAGLPAWSAEKSAALPASSKSFFNAYCTECHDSETKKGDLDLATLTGDLKDDKNFERWAKLYDRVKDGEMPPAKKKRPEAGALNAFLTAAQGELYQASAQKQRERSRVTMRRLNRVEYENTVHDLLGIQTQLANLLPEDGQAHGFDRVDEALTLSTVQVEKYLEAADLALDVALGVGPQPKYLKEHYAGTSMVAGWAGKSSKVLEKDAVAFFSSGYAPNELRPFRAPAAGSYRIRISAQGFQSKGERVTMRVYSGNFGVGGKTKSQGYFSIAADAPQVTEIIAQLDNRNDTIRVIPYGTITWMNDAATYTGPGLVVHWVEMEGPLEASVWPPVTRKQLIGEADLEKGTAADGAKILAGFATRAFRRPVNDGELAPYVKLVNDRLEKGVKFAEALRVGLKAILVSPRFLMLEETPGPLDGYAMASRLSYFLWSTMPDAPLMEAAARGELSKPETLRKQTERMLSDPRAHGFTENFTGQWLNLRNIDFTTPDPRLYPEFDEFLKLSMVGETHAFFEEILRNDLSLLNFLESDFAMLNERMARHYGIKDVTGLEFRKVMLPPDSHRGGVMTQASVLKVTANGTNTSPVIRGAWVMDRIVGKPIPAPPAGVPAVEPDIRGAKTLREQLVKHRESERCMTCHARMDPPGCALENYDVIGGWRERFRITPARGQRADYMTLKVDQREQRIAIGPNVDAADVLPDGRKFSNVMELKKLLLADKDQIARGLAERLLVYATGHAMEFCDRQAVSGIVDRVKAKDYGFRTLVHEIIQSETFRNK